MGDCAVLSDSHDPPQTLPPQGRVTAADGYDNDGGGDDGDDDGA